MTTRLPSGMRKHKIDIRTSIETTNTHGEITRDYHTLRTVWGAVEMLSGRELDVARQIKPTLSHKVTIPFVRGVTEEMQLRARDRSFGIVSIDNRDLSDVELVCMCEEVR